MIVTAGDDLLKRARQAHAVRPDVTITELLQLGSAISLASEREPDGVPDADRLLALALDGVPPRGA